MISKDGRYWATAIVVKWDEHGDRWSGSIDFLDDGFCDDDADAGRVSTEGTLHTRYFVRDGQTVPALRAVIDALVADAERLGIQFGVGNQGPTIFYKGDGEGVEWPPPPRWRQLLADECARLGWKPAYADPAAVGAGAAASETEN